MGRHGSPPRPLSRGWRRSGQRHAPVEDRAGGCGRIGRARAAEFVGDVRPRLAGTDRRWPPSRRWCRASLKADVGIEAKAGARRRRERGPRCIARVGERRPSWEMANNGWITLSSPGDAYEGLHCGRRPPRPRAGRPRPATCRGHGGTSSWSSRRKTRMATTSRPPLPGDSLIALEVAVEDLTRLGQQVGFGERLVEENDAGFESALGGQDGLGVAGHEQHVDIWS